MKKANVLPPPFPKGLVQTAQYGNSVKAHGVYMSVEQAVSVERISEHLENQIRVPVSGGSIYKFKKEVYTLLEDFEPWVKVLDPTANKEARVFDPRDSGETGPCL
jgi:hypothetical protein